MDITTMKTTEQTTIDCAVLAHNFDTALNAYNDALQSVHTTYNAHLSVCESIRKAGFTTVQSGHVKNKKPVKGAFPYLVLANEIEKNYIEKWHAGFTWTDDHKGYIKADLARIANVVKQKIATLSFYLETGKFTSNVGKDKPRLLWESVSEEYDKLEAKEAKALQETKAANAIAAKSKLAAANMQAAAKLAAEQKEPDDLVKQIAEEERRLETEAKEDAANSQAAADILAKLKKAAADKAAEVAKAKAALDAKNAKTKKAPSVATDADGKTNHDASTVISKDATIGRDSALKVKKAIAAIVDNMSLIEVREVYRALGLVLLDAKMEF